MRIPASGRLSMGRRSDLSHHHLKSLTDISLSGGSFDFDYQDFGRSTLYVSGTIGGTGSDSDAAGDEAAVLRGFAEISSWPQGICLRYSQENKISSAAAAASSSALGRSSSSTSCLSHTPEMTLIRSPAPMPRSDQGSFPPSG